MRSFTVVLTPDYESGGYTVSVPALPGCITDGESIEMALSRAQEAIELYLEDEDELLHLEPASGPTVVVARVSVA
ncbi:MAG: type II toxin-antitoxin system HicB family antitoxin [Thermomicrobiales bacterium]